MKLRKKLETQIILIIAVALFLIIAIAFLPGYKPGAKPQRGLEYVELPKGFNIEMFAKDLGSSTTSGAGPGPGPRMMLIKDGVLFATLTMQGKVVALPDQNKDFRADATVTFIGGLNKPHGIDFYQGWFYIAEENRVIRVKDANNDLRADSGTLEVLIDDLPIGGHFTRTIKVRDGNLYLSIGSSCNVCNETDPRRAAITKCDADGKNCGLFAKGLRNAVGFVFHPLSGRMYATDNGRDWLGDDLPPDEINIVEERYNYGWPKCYGENIHDTNFDNSFYIRKPCVVPTATPSLIDLPAHSAPLGLAFYYGKNFPEEHKGDLFVAYHGSWNRGVPTGYKVVKIDAQTLAIEDFATGWLNGTRVLGRPVDIVVGEDGGMYVSDDNAGKIYRIYYRGL